MGLFSKKDKTVKIFISGKELKCSACGHLEFRHRKAQLNTATMSILDLDWANKSAHCYVCDNCTKIKWFLEQQHH